MDIQSAFYEKELSIDLALISLLFILYFRESEDLLSSTRNLRGVYDKVMISLKRREVLNQLDESIIDWIKIPLSPFEEKCEPDLHLH